MRRLSQVTVGVLLMIAATAHGFEFSNLLLNSGFESGSGDAPSGWERWGAASRDPAANHSGAYAGRLTGNDSGPWNASGLYQDFPAASGVLWRATAWAMCRSADPVQGPNLGILSMEFYDAESNKLWAPECPLMITKDTPQDVWMNLSVEAISPWRTTRARFLLIHWQASNDSGSAWFDDCAFGLAPTTTIWFAGRPWAVRSWDGPPGPNPWSTNGVWVDGEGRLHLQMRKQGDRWYAAEVEGLESLGYGEYRWALASRVDLLDTNVVGGLYTFADPARSGEMNATNELDIEFNRSFENTGGTGLIYSVQPYLNPGNQHTLNMVLTNENTVHSINWRPGDIHFQSLYGTGAAPAAAGAPIDQWHYVLSGVPSHVGDTPRMNLWLYNVHEPQDTQHLEMIVQDFLFIPCGSDLLTDDFADGVRGSPWTLLSPLSSQIMETNDLLQVSPDGDWRTAGYATTNTLNWNANRERFVFSATLSTILVQTATSGEDLRAVLQLCSTVDNAWGAPHAVQVQARYDADTDTIVFVLLTKTNQPLSDGTERYNATLASASAYWGAGRGMHVSIELQTNVYCLRLADAAGADLPVTVNSGSATGPHNLGDALFNSYWVVGAQNGGAGRGRLCWDSTVVGTDLPALSPTVAAALDNGCWRLSWTSQVNKCYSASRTTNLLSPFVVFRTNMPAQPTVNIIEDAVGSPVMFYGVSVH